MAIRTLSHTCPSRPARRAFSLIELLVVILIIGIIVAIVLPALHHVRGAAIETDSKQLVTQISNAGSTFFNDKRRSPGYFTPMEMGDIQNQTRGFTAMQNAMLDLAGGIVKTGTNGSILIGPGTVANRQVSYLAEAVGATGSGSYFVPTAKYLKLQNGTEGGTREGDPVHAQVAEVVDAWGQPILAWTEDPTAKQSVQSIADFANTSAPVAAADVSARFYLNSNYALLASDTFGKQRRNQREFSILSPSQNNASTSLAGALGNPGAPDDTSKNLTSIFPTRSRGAFIVQSAGKDGIILSREDRKAANVVENAGNNATAVLNFGSNFKSLPGPAGTALRDASGKAISVDVLTSFDDIIASSN